MGLSESQGEGHERFIHSCPKPFISTKDLRATAPGMRRIWDSAGPGEGIQGVFEAWPPEPAPLISLGCDGNFLNAIELGGVVHPCPRTGIAPLTQGWG